jgi:hypothetical protein
MDNVDGRIPNPVPVEIRNWPDPAPAKPPLVRNTTLKTYIIDPAGSAGEKRVQITDFEPNRLRMAIQVIDAAVALTNEVPTNSPDVSTSSTAPQGRYLPPNVAAPDYEFFGPDALWLNSLGTITRVTVTKEYRDG